MLRSITVLCGTAVGSYIAIGGLNYFEKHGKTLKAEDAGLKCKKSELKLVQVLFRHGARTPLQLIPGLEECLWNEHELTYQLPHTKLEYHLRDLKDRKLPEETSSTKPRLPGGCRKGQMTVVGQQQLFDLGEKLRKLYIDELNFLDETFDPRHVSLRTTNVERTIESLRCLVAGMFANVPGPVTFWTIPGPEEFMKPNWHSCKALGQFLNYVYMNGHLLSEYKEDLDNFFVEIGQPTPGLTFINIFDTLSCRRAHNQPCPVKIKNFMDTIEKHAIEQMSGPLFSAPHWTKGLVLPLACGKMLQQLYDNMKAKVSNSNSYKMYLFSVHDVTLIAFFSAIGIKLDKWPPFGAYVSLELYEDEKREHFVRLVYCGEVIKIKKFNQDFISLAQFKDLVSPLFIEDVQKGCETKFFPPEH